MGRHLALSAVQSLSLPVSAGACNSPKRTSQGDRVKPIADAEPEFAPPWGNLINSDFVPIPPPREALASGCPIVGYGSAYPKELVEPHCGGLFVPVGDWKGLARMVKDLAKNPEALGELIKNASRSGRLYDRDTALQRRINLIKEYLRPAVYPIA